MKRVLIVVALLATVAVGIAATATPSVAARAGFNQARRGPIARLIQLERRKNEWLRRTFFGG